MSKLRFALNILAIAVFSLGISSVAQAQACRTWVSGVGDDVNPCSRTAPCKTFAGAISKTAECGEIDVLDPGGFGAVTITKCMTIDGTYGAGFGSILVSGTSGVVVNVTTNPATAKVTLRRLSINGGCLPTSSIHGISYLAGNSLHVQQCDIFGFGQNGINIALSTSGNATIQDTTIREVGGSAISATASSGNVAVVVTNAQIDKAPNGLSAALNSVVTVRNSTFALCATNGINTANNAQVNVTDSLFANDGTGINIAAGATARLNNNVFANNGTGVANAGTGVSPASNNKFIGNGTDRSGAVFTTVGSSVQ
jgi:Periplasmic copper-binding protein (NosD)